MPFAGSSRRTVLPRRRGTTRRRWRRGRSRDDLAVGPQSFTPQFIDAARPSRHATGDRWFADEVRHAESSGQSGHSTQRSRRPPRPAQSRSRPRSQDGNGELPVVCGGLLQQDDAPVSVPMLAAGTPTPDVVQDRPSSSSTRIRIVGAARIAQRPVRTPANPARVSAPGRWHPSSGRRSPCPPSPRRSHYRPGGRRSAALIR